MSMPQPIHVALVGSSAELVSRAKTHFRLSAPGIGAAYLATLDLECTDPIRRLDDIPTGLIQLWVALDREALAASQNHYRSDVRNSTYNRGFFDELLPDACILVDYERSPSAAKKELAALAQRIIKAWYDTS